MALVKKSKIAPVPAAVRQSTAAKSAGTATPGAAAKIGARAPTPPGRRETAAERMAAATEELASGLAEAAAATKELGQSMEQIAAGAEEAAGAAQEQSAAIKAIAASLSSAKAEADASSRRTEAVSISLAEASTQIMASARAIERSAQRQGEWVDLIVELDRRAKDIGDITRVVSRLADQTNLLALNAAIEAARAGAEGRGFAVVADEVRTLAEASDVSAREVQKLTQAIQSDVVEVRDQLSRAAASGAKDAATAVDVVSALQSRRGDMVEIAEGSRGVLTAAQEAERAATEAQKGAEQVAGAAEEQSSAAAEAQTAVSQQATSMDQGQSAAQGLASMVDKLRGGRTNASSIEQIGASAEELSASIQELSSAASQVMAAVDQISKAAQLQSSATHQTSTALNQIESGARLAQKNGKTGDDRVRNLDGALKAGRRTIEALAANVTNALGDTRSSLGTIKRLVDVGRSIDKNVDAMALVAVQTSMLAVSGSVEAARAGDAGQGFAVVSTDIRALSREASANVDRAKDTVRGILDYLGVLKADLDQFIVSAEIEVENNRAVSAQLEGIEHEVASLAAASAAILRGADVILASTGQMSAAARQIATASEEASSAAREAATAAAQQARGAEDLAAAIEEIAALADELKHQTV